MRGLRRFWTVRGGYWTVHEGYWTVHEGYWTVRRRFDSGLTQGRASIDLEHFKSEKLCKKYVSGDFFGTPQITQKQLHELPNPTFMPSIVEKQLASRRSEPLEHQIDRSDHSRHSDLSHSIAIFFQIRVPRVIRSIDLMLERL